MSRVLEQPAKDVVIHLDVQITPVAGEEVIEQMGFKDGFVLDGSAPGATLGTECTLASRRICEAVETATILVDDERGVLLTVVGSVFDEEAPPEQKAYKVFYNCEVVNTGARRPLKHNNLTLVLRNMTRALISSEVEFVTLGREGL